jgi:hypothetical protein
MGDMPLTMPLAVPPEGADPSSFYASFANKLTSSWSPTTGLEVWLAAEPEIGGLYAPIKSALRFAPAGTLLRGTVLSTDTLVLTTWPTTYVDLKNVMDSIPTEILMENVDTNSVRSAVEPLFTALGRSQNAVDAFMAGNGLLRIPARTLIGSGATMSNPPTASKPIYLRIVLLDGSGSEINTLQFFSDTATYLGIDTTQHPLLSQLDLHGWIEITVLDASGIPLINEPYKLFFEDGSSRGGTTNNKGRIYESGIPLGSWALDLPNHPSFSLE